MIGRSKYPLEERFQQSVSSLKMIPLLDGQHMSDFRMFSFEEKSCETSVARHNRPNEVIMIFFMQLSGSPICHKRIQKFFNDADLIEQTMNFDIAKLAGRFFTSSVQDNHLECNIFWRNPVCNFLDRHFCPADKARVVDQRKYKCSAHRSSVNQLLGLFSRRFPVFQAASNYFDYCSVLHYPV